MNLVFRRVLALAPIGLTLLSASVARAEGEAPPAPGDTSADVRIAGQIGGYGGADGGGPAIGILALGRYANFEGGIDAQAGTALFRGGYGYVALAGGLGLVPGARWRIDLLGELGLDAYQGFGGRHLLSSDPGANATLPCAGARVGVARRFGRFELGLSGTFGEDLTRPTVTYTYTDQGGGLFFGGAGGPTTRTVTVGGERLGVMLAMGSGFDL
jgi:hypothetical protein